MAHSLNKNRLRLSKLAVLFLIVGVLFTRPYFDDETPTAELFEVFGNIFVIACILGRVYSTAFIGGRKNATLITYGPFSISRNPLYFFSFLGACGLGILSGHVILAIMAPIIFCLIYFPVIAREEAYLLEHFGEPYLSYCRTTPRFTPKLSRYHAPESVPMSPQHLRYALRDAMLWFCALPFFELVEYFHDQPFAQHLPVLF